MISPILTYNNEVWGAFVKSDFISWDSSGIEKTNQHFCKRYLEVHNKSSNQGRFPLIIDINKKIINYLNYLHEGDENSIVKVFRYCFLETIPIFFNRCKSNFILV